MGWEETRIEPAVVRNRNEALGGKPVIDSYYQNLMRNTSLFLGKFTPFLVVATIHVFEVLYIKRSEDENSRNSVDI